MWALRSLRDRCGTLYTYYSFRCNLAKSFSLADSSNTSHDHMFSGPPPHFHGDRSFNSISKNEPHYQQSVVYQDIRLAYNGNDEDITDFSNSYSR